MTRWQRFKHRSYIYFRYDLWDDLRDVWRRIWNKRLKLWWHRLFIRKNEFHSSLDYDPYAMTGLNPGEFEAQRLDLIRRRMIADERAKKRKGV